MWHILILRTCRNSERQYVFSWGKCEIGRWLFHQEMHLTLPEIQNIWATKYVSVVSLVSQTINSTAATEMAGTGFRALILQHHRTLHLLPLSWVLQGWVCQGHCRRGISVNCCQKRSAKLASITVGLLPGSQKISNTSRKSQEHLRREENALFRSSNDT